jgi:NMD protein affecting ribosome stability and mRNA decay
MPIGRIYYLRLSQKQNYTRKLDTSVNVSNYSFMLEIATFLKTDVVTRERDRNYLIERIYEVRTQKLESKIVLFDYLSKFPLFG